jgi:hypothetical protein
MDMQMGKYVATRRGNSYLMAPMYSLNSPTFFCLHIFSLCMRRLRIRTVRPKTEKAQTSLCELSNRCRPFETQTNRKLSLTVSRTWDYIYIYNGWLYSSRIRIWSNIHASLFWDGILKPVSLFLDEIPFRVESMRFALLVYDRTQCLQ